MALSRGRPSSGLAPGESNRLLEVRDLKVHFPIAPGLLHRQKGAIRAVDGVSFSVGAAETLGVVGESGCGKSTMIRAILQLIRPTSGSVRFQGEELTRLKESSLRMVRREMQIVFQDPYGSLNPRKKVGSVVAEPLVVHGIAKRKARGERVQELLRLVQLSPTDADRFPHEFSGGQRQRIAIARALASEACLLMCDEPVSALDVSIQAQTINLLQDLKKRLGLSYVFVSHDLSVVRHVSDRIAVMYLGKIVENSSTHELYDGPLHPYSIALLSAVPRADPVVERTRQRILLRGEVPSPSNPPSGCHFRTRCWLSELLGKPAKCAAEEPELRDMGNGHLVSCHFAEELQTRTRRERLLEQVSQVSESNRTKSRKWPNKMEGHIL